MGFQTVFKRYEKKYMVTDSQKQKFLAAICGYIRPDEYGESTICNIYFDTPNYQLIRTSMEKPVYKEKLRLRTYGIPSADSTAFIELKKKYRGVVYKRRISVNYLQGCQYLSKGVKPQCKNQQVLSEIDYFIDFYKGIKPSVALFYDRTAYYCKTDRELRFTFDSNIRYRKNKFDLRYGDEGKHLLPDGVSILEIKCLGSMPVWLTRVLSELGIFPASYSKYGKAYTEMGIEY